MGVEVEGAEEEEVVAARHFWWVERGQAGEANPRSAAGWTAAGEDAGCSWPVERTWRTAGS